MQPANFAGCEIWQPANFAGCEIFQLAKFRRLPIFATCEHCSPMPRLCLLTAFYPPFWWFYTSLPSCKFGSFKHYCNFLILSTYISSAMLVIKSTYHSINHSGWNEASCLLLLVIFSSSPFTFLHFLGSQTLLNDDKSRDAQIKPPDH